MGAQYRRSSRSRTPSGRALPTSSIVAARSPKVTEGSTRRATSTADHASPDGRRLRTRSLDGAGSERGPVADDAYLASRARLIDPRRAQDFGAGNPARGGTIYLTTADEQGMMVSFIQSNYLGFGSGVVVPGYGLSLQNRGHGFSLDPASPNAVAPGKRPFHTIIPAFLTKPKAGKGMEAVMSFGVMGANMQPQGHLQALVRMLDHGQNPQAACDAPRWRFNAGLELNVEAAMRRDTVEGLAARGHRLAVIEDSYQDFGAGQFIWRLGDPGTEGYAAASDPRRDGQAVVS
jgi:gamma-glutamyltranspeptidase/glutathione hydrolase